MTVGWSSVMPTWYSCFSSAMLRAMYFGPGGSHFMAYAVFSDTGRTAQIS